MPLSDILNYRTFTDQISLSGQPTEAQILELAQNGVSDVINLGPHDNKGALADEPTSVQRANMVYHYIPVDFENPTEADYARFREILSQLAGHRLHIHCIYNARVSAFMMRYSKDTNGDVAATQSLMESIWKPGGVWAAFLGHQDDVSLPNRYLGYDYE